MIKFIICLVIYYFDSIILKLVKINPGKKRILFFNNGKLGDVIISSAIIDNQDYFGDFDVHFLFNQKYEKLFINYCGKYHLHFYNYEKLKKSICYKYSLIKEHRFIGYEKIYNLSQARGFITDEMCLLMKANETFCIVNDFKYLGKYLGKYFNKKYTHILFSSIKNVYEKHYKIMEAISGKNCYGFMNKYLFQVKRNIYANYILISPFTTLKSKNWGTGKYIELAYDLSKKYKIILTGHKNDFNEINVKNINLNDNIILNHSDLNDLPELIFNCKLFIGNDSGLLHLAIKFAKPFMGILLGELYHNYYPFKIASKYYIFISKLNDNILLKLSGNNKVVEKTEINKDLILTELKKILEKID